MIRLHIYCNICGGWPWLRAGSGSETMCPSPSWCRPHGCSEHCQGLRQPLLTFAQGSKPTGLCPQGSHSECAVTAAVFVITKAAHAQFRSHVPSSAAARASVSGYSSRARARCFHSKHCHIRHHVSASHAQVQLARPITALATCARLAASVRLHYQVSGTCSGHCHDEC